MRSWSSQTHRNEYLKSFPVGGLVIGFSWWLSKTRNEICQKYDQPPSSTRHQIVIGAWTLVKNVQLQYWRHDHEARHVFNLNDALIEANLKRFGEAMQEFGKARDIFKMLCAVGEHFFCCLTCCFFPLTFDSHETCFNSIFHPLVSSVFTSSEDQKELVDSFVLL